MMTFNEYERFFWLELDPEYMQSILQSWHGLYTKQYAFKKDYPTQQEVKDFDLSFCGR